MSRRIFLVSENMVSRTPRRVNEIKIRTILELYQLGRGSQSIARSVELSPATVWRVLKRIVKTRPRGWKGSRCVDCGAMTSGAKRCRFHAKIRNAETNLEAVHKYKRRKISVTAKWEHGSEVARFRLDKPAMAPPGVVVRHDVLFMSDGCVLTKTHIVGGKAQHKVFRGRNHTKPGWNELRPIGDAPEVQDQLKPKYDYEAYFTKKGYVRISCHL